MGNVEAAWRRVASAKRGRIEAWGMGRVSPPQWIRGLGDAEREAPKALTIANSLRAMLPETEWRAPKAEESIRK